MWRECGISCAKTAEPTEVPFRTVSRVDPRNRVLNGHAHRRTWQIRLNDCARRL